MADTFPGEPGDCMVTTIAEESDRSSMLKRAREHIFFTGVDDSAAALCRHNMQYGLAKIHWLQQELGHSPDATFISAPDATITRNKHRWGSGIGYGGKISWGPGDDKIIILDVMPNACGMLCGGLDELPKAEKVLKRISELDNQTSEIKGIPIKWDFAHGNHFINVFKLERLEDFDFPQYAFIIHGSVPELKGGHEVTNGIGLYYHNCKTLREMAEVYRTPFGDVKVLLGDEATKYWDFYQFADGVSKDRRIEAANQIFEDYSVITNPNHQGLINLNEITLGTHSSDDKGANDGLFPLALRADLPCYLIRGFPNFNEEMIDVLGFFKRGERLGVMNRLENANILPHGGGYTFPSISSVLDVMQTSPDGPRFFVADLANGVGVQIFQDTSALQFTYRGRQVLARTLELGLGEVVAKLIPETVLKV